MQTTITQQQQHGRVRRHIQRHLAAYARTLTLLGAALATMTLASDYGNAWSLACSLLTIVFGALSWTRTHRQDRRGGEHGGQ